MFDRAAAIDTAFREAVSSGVFPAPASADGSVLSDVQLASLFETQLMSRHLDFMARKTKGKTFYSIGSSGHEGLAALAEAARGDDLAFLHYRDAAFAIHRRRALPGSTPLWDMALSFAASAEDPVSGGRHKVLGGTDIWAPPQTSTIASHLPKAVGAAHAIALAQKTQHADRQLKDDSIIICSFGDASANHSTAQGAINAACWAAYQGSPMPILFVCEDNGIGISVPTPDGWTAANYANRPALKYIAGDGTDLTSTYAKASEAISYVRQRRRPVFLHLSMVRLMGHAGADIEAAYSQLEHIERAEQRDPLLRTAQQLIGRRVMSAADILTAYDGMQARVMRVAEAAFTRPKLTSAKAVMAPLVPPAKPSVSRAVTKADAISKAAASKPVPMARHINQALTEIMATYDNALVFGEDVARKGGVYGVTQGLLSQFGPARVMDTLLDEQTILGMAIGAAHNGFVPIPEIQFLAYVHNAEDQIRGEAATLSFFSNGQYTNPMVIRIPGLAYQRGFGGHFHNDNSLAIFRDIPGVVVACPSNGTDAAAMLRTCVELAHREQRVVIFIEPIALYQTAALNTPGDKAWLAPYTPAPQAPDVAFGEIGQHGRGTELCILTYGNGYYLSRQAEQILRKDDKIRTRIIDMRWLQPLPEAAILKAVKPCKHVLIVDECRRTGSMSEQLITLLNENSIDAPIARVVAEDSFIPLGDAAYTVLPSTDDIISAARKLTGRGS